MREKQDPSRETQWTRRDVWQAGVRGSLVLAAGGVGYFTAKFMLPIAKFRDPEIGESFKVVVGEYGEGLDGVFIQQGKKERLEEIAKNSHDNFSFKKGELRVYGFAVQGSAMQKISKKFDSDQYSTLRIALVGNPEMIVFAYRSKDESYSDYVYVLTETDPKVFTIEERRFPESP